MFLTAKLNLLSGMAIGAGAVLLMKQCCKQRKQHQKTTTHHSSEVVSPKGGDAWAEAVLIVASNKGVKSFVFHQKQLWLQPINFCCLRSLLGHSWRQILSDRGPWLSTASLATTTTDTRLWPRVYKENLSGKWWPGAVLVPYRCTS